MTTVVIAGSRALPHGQAARVLIRFLAALPPDALVLMRRGLNTQPGHFESQVEQVCDLIGLELEWCQPQPGGRTEVWARDVEMVDRADLVLAFVTEAQVGDETSGTAALIDKAMSTDTAAYLYSMNEAGDATRAGEWDPDDLWGNLAPVGYSGAHDDGGAVSS